jgi:hypothetical protein
VSSHKLLTNTLRRNHEVSKVSTYFTTARQAQDTPNPLCLLATTEVRYHLSISINIFNILLLLLSLYVSSFKFKKVLAIVLPQKRGYVLPYLFKAKPHKGLQVSS